MRGGKQTPVCSRTVHSSTVTHNYMKKRFKVNISKRMADHLIQAVLIFFSVLFAFWLNDYRSGTTENKRAESILEYVQTEFVNNKKTLESWVPYHENLTEKAKEYASKQNDSIVGFNLYKIVDANKGIFKSVITNNAKEQFKNNTNIALELNLKVTRIYEQQEYVENALNDVLEFLKQRELYNSGLTDINYKIFSQLIDELYHQERALIESYEYGIEEINKHLNK